MESTKIPKPMPGLKPPAKTTKALTKPLNSIPENKPTKTIPASSTREIKILPQSKNILRRRSKSVTDLRSLSSKSTALKPSLKENIPSNSQGNTLKVGQKRPPNKSADEVKPKVAKVKIPDWDYKSRFQQLQQKHSLLQEDLKLNKNILLGLEDARKELENIRQENGNKQKQITILEARNEIIMRENEFLHTENSDVKNQLAKLQTDHQLLRAQFENLFKENKENLLMCTALQKKKSAVQSELTDMTIKYKNSEITVKQLKESLENHENLRRILHNTIQDLKGNIRVFCRVRPPINADEYKKLQCSLEFPDECSLEIRKSGRSGSPISGKPTDLTQTFTFDKTFPPEATQGEVFEELSQLVQSALDGYHVCVFAYGQTGSGKTYTMQGSAQDHGMIPRTIDLIFENIEKLKLSNWDYTVTASFLEIYNENVKDLLETNSSSNHELRYNEGRGVTVTNLTIIPISSAAGLKEFMEKAHKNRAVASTDFNLHSSRSHAVTKVHLKGHNNTSKITYRGSINLVDLAGSESAKTSSAERLTETKNINKSLSALGNVMLALHNKDAHVPYRNSKLTFLLQSCLGGNSKTLMFVNISPFEECYGENINSLRFAAKVKDIKTHARKNKGYINTPLLQTSKPIF